MINNDLSENHPVTRVLVTGGAGSVGLEVLKELQLHKKWYEVKVLDQNRPEVLRRLKPFFKDFQLILGNLCDQKILDRATADIDFVIHLAAIIPPLADRDPELAEKTNIEGTRALIHSVTRHSPSAFFLYTSSISVYGDRVYNPWITAEDPLLPSEGDEYAKTKIIAESILRKSRLRWSIFRLSAIMGPQTRLDPLFFHMPLDTSLEIATAHDTGFALVESIYHQDELKGRTFNLSGGEKCRATYRGFLSRVFKIMGLEKLELPDKAFATRNFHCGNYADAGLLEKILHFQQDTLEDYYWSLDKMSSKFTKRIYSTFHSLIRVFLLMKSEPLRARKKKKKHGQYMRFFYAEPLTTT
ncbi:MAG: NAD(P)-dependent oxidoreductase [Bacteroidales bacterium]|jgi:nucleoside-diphosphate-sugar epimerase